MDKITDHQYMEAALAGQPTDNCVVCNLSEDAHDYEYDGEWPTYYRPDSDLYDFARFEMGE